MPMRPPAPPSLPRPMPPAQRAPIRPAPPTGRLYGAPRRAGFDWLRASADPYGSGRNPFGPGGFVTQAELGNLSYGYTGPVGRGGGVTTIVEDVYDDDDDSDMGCDTSLPEALPANMGRDSVHTDKKSGRTTGVNFGWEPWEGREWSARRYGRERIPSAPVAPPSPPAAPFGFGNLTSFLRPSAPTGYGYRPPPPSDNPLAMWSHMVNQLAGISGEVGQDASFGWMMPTLPGAISESPLRGRFAPDSDLTGSMGLGGIS
jgi:hypothetical protein